MEKQTTILNEVSFSGIGLHTGKEVNMTLIPAAENSGILIKRKDLRDKILPARLEYVYNTKKEVGLAKEGVQIKTIEHLLSAITGLGIDNIIIELDNIEPPVTDGSAMIYVELLKKASIKELPAKRLYLDVEYTQVKENGSSITLIPQNDGLQISCLISFPNTFIDTQYISLELTAENFETQIASARTFGFLSEVQVLKEQGLITGGNLNNAIIIDGKLMLNTEPLRYKDEFVRHKVLDMIGDLSLIGYRLKAHIIAIKPSHTLNIALGKRLIENSKLFLSTKNFLDITDIQRIIPHRYPFLLVDKIIEYKLNNRIVGIKNVSINEEFFEGHFPNRPIMPGVLIIEGMAQVGGLLVLLSFNQNNFVYFAGIDKAKFRRPVIPGDTIRYEVKAVKIRTKLSIVEAKAYVEDKLVAEAELMFSIK